MLGIDGKNKDTDKAWMDLEKMNIREILNLEVLPDGSCRKPRTIFSLNTTERDGFYDFLKSVKYPDGYAANISRYVSINFVAYVIILPIHFSLKVSRNSKRYVSNRARLEGLIAKAYILKECITFCSMYLDGIETVHNQREQNEDSGECSKGLAVFTQIAQPTGCRRIDGELSDELREVL
ncbi:ribosomal RNA processing Brix domain protein [Fagus crenata]